MRLEARGDKWIVFDENGCIALMTHHKGIALRFIKNHLNSDEE